MRIIRLLVTVVVARLLTPEHYGLAAIALITHEFGHVFARAGTSSKIVYASKEQLESICANAYTLNWLIGTLLFLAQCLIAFLLSLWYDNHAVLWPIIYLAIGFLLMPFAMVHAARNFRNNRLNIVAKSEIRQAVADAVLTIILAIAGFGLWALVIPKLLVVPIWIYTHRSVEHWSPPSKLTLSGAGAILIYTRQVIGVELLSAIRNNVDYILVGSFLGIHALGIYYFAYNAGLGITRGLIMALNNALFPHLCSSGEQKADLNERFVFAVKVISSIVIPVVVLQASLAPFYVPIVFGSKWIEAGALPILMLICLAGIPIALAEAGTQYLRATGQQARDLSWHWKFTSIYIVALVIGLSGNTTGVAMAVLITHLIALPVYYTVNIVSLLRKNRTAGTATI